ncbi:energy transducer TonB [Pricia sp. S334]|uniref:Energy transducer TonB n=1 Tax=Pricia mediterranea TaxID=3076079 RepID=A0ABU3L6N0_9FLAO|nr:energy transducer TonB [Pricia sp. S334]MDT7829409.1 energy transducer TonB [Pricia sp. S334]
MKNILFIIALIFYTNAGAQTQQLDGQGPALADGETVPFAVVHHVPIFPGCEEAGNKRDCFRNSLQLHISKNFRYPKEAERKEIEGMISVLFTISKTGAIENIMTKGSHQLLEDEVRRIITLLPTMKPGNHKGELVNVPFALPIRFDLCKAS